MKKLISMTLAALLAAALLAGCGSKPMQNEPIDTSAPSSNSHESTPSTQSSNSENSTPSASNAMPDLSGLPEEAQKAVGDALAKVQSEGMTLPDNWDKMSDEEKTDWALQQVMNTEWPKDKLPVDFPEYKGGKVVNSGGSADDFVVLVEGSKETLKAYLTELEAVGYTVDDTYNTAKKGGVSVEFSDRGEGMWQMNIYIQAESVWPDNIPEFITKPERKTLIGEPYLDDQGSLVNLSLDINDMTEDECKAWLDAMAANWADVDSDGTRWDGTVEIDGKPWSVYAELYEVSGGVCTVLLSWSED